MPLKTDTIDAYIGKCSAEVAALLQEMRRFIHDTLPGATEGMQYGAPVFYNASGVAVIYLFGSKAHVNFGFLKSAQLADPVGVLKGSGTPSKHIRIYPDKPVDEELLRGFVKQCAGLKA